MSSTIPSTGNLTLPIGRLTGDAAKDVSTLHRSLSDFLLQFGQGQNVYGQLADIQSRLAAVEADIVAIKAFVGMPP